MTIHTTLKPVTLAVLSAATVLLAACGADEEHAATTYGSTPAQQASQPETAGQMIDRNAEKLGAAVSDAIEGAGQAVEDAAITTAVKAELINAEEVDALKIDVDTRNGAVTLTGTAPSDGAREKAEAIAEQVEGVRTVHNKLALATP